MVQLSQVPMTIEGAEKLRAELTNLKSVERPRIINAIAEARANIFNFKFIYLLPCVLNLYVNRCVLFSG